MVMRLKPSFFIFILLLSFSAHTQAASWCDWFFFRNQEVKVTKGSVGILRGSYDYKFKQFVVEELLEQEAFVAKFADGSSKILKNNTPDSYIALDLQETILEPVFDYKLEPQSDIILSINKDGVIEEGRIKQVFKRATNSDVHFMVYQVEFAGNETRLINGLPFIRPKKPIKSVTIGKNKIRPGEVIYNANAKSEVLEIFPGNRALVQTTIGDEVEKELIELVKPDNYVIRNINLNKKVKVQLNPQTVSEGTITQTFVSLTTNPGSERKYYKVLFSDGTTKTLKEDQVNF